LQRIDNSRQSQFRIISPENAWNLQGNFVTQPLQIDWSSAVVISQAGDQWLTYSAWTLASSVNLEGRLRFAMPPGALGPDPRKEPNDSSIDPRWTVTVNGSPAVVRHERILSNDSESADGESVSNPVATADESRSVFGSHDVWEIVSPELNFGPHRIDLELKQPILSKRDGLGQPIAVNGDDTTRGSVASELLLPIPLADRLTVSSPVTLQLPRGINDVDGRMWRPIPDMDGVLGELSTTGDFQYDSSEAAGSDQAVSNPQWSFARVPDFPIPLILRSRSAEEQATEIPRSFLRSLIGKRYRHEHLLALIRKGRRVRLELPAAMKSIRVEVRLDGRPIESVRDAAGLRIDLPELELASTAGTASLNPSAPPQMLPRRDHLLDVRIWTESESHPWWSQIEPMIRLPIGSGLQYWQLVVPSDSHLFRASSQSGRAMRWEQNGLRLARFPSIDDSALIRWTTEAGWNLDDGTSVSSSDTTD
ncbi:unnamed protein product, partial [Hapterophycus canaliculatus]